MLLIVSCNFMHICLMPLDMFRVFVLITCECTFFKHVPVSCTCKCSMYLHLYLSHLLVIVKSRLVNSCNVKKIFQFGIQRIILVFKAKLKSKLVVKFIKTNGKPSNMIKCSTWYSKENLRLKVIYAGCEQLTLCLSEVSWLSLSIVTEV